MTEQKRNRNFDKLILEAIQENQSFFAWKAVAGEVSKCELKIKAFRKEYNEIELELVNEKTSKISDIVSGDKIINIYIPESSLSFSTELKSINSVNKVKIAIPKEYTFYERRKYERVEPSKTCFISFEHNKIVVKKSIFDLSIGGFAVILPKSDKLVIGKGKEFPNMTLELGKLKIKIKAECTNSFMIDRYKFENLPYGGFKMAFRFTGISMEDKVLLTEYVIHEILMKSSLKKAN